MDVSTITHNYLDRFKAQHGRTTTRDQWSALNAMLGCRTPQYGQLYLSCSGCDWQSTCFQSCGHRSCNRCQNHCTTQWLDRQVNKLLPVDYFMATFTLPSELRSLARLNQKLIYTLLFECATSTLKSFGLNEQDFNAELAMTGVLHTHTRRLDYHPHVHIVLPGGGLNAKRKAWIKVKNKYLFNGRNLAAVFRARLLAAIVQAGFAVPVTPRRWIVQCKRVGRGLPALQYLSRYLYRGVISNNKIVRDDGEYVTFEYKESKTNLTKTRRIKGEDFIKLILQHTLPKGFRRVRNYGFLHGNAKRVLRLVQWVLQVAIPRVRKRPRPQFVCDKCHSAMVVVGFSRMHLKPG